ncbi:2763_t:CDS:1, partial [Racocetra fulgida]
MIIVVDNDFRNLIVAVALLEDETEATFARILNELKVACEITLTVIYLDLDPALILAI